MTTESSQNATSQPAEKASRALRVRWDEAGAKTSYANVCNAASTREEVILFFGLNRAWKAGQRDLQVQVTDRIILSPPAAKRLALLLNKVLQEYEARFGALPAPGAGRGAAR